MQYSNFLTIIYSQSIWLYFLLIAIFSLLVGSFLNVVIHRLPKMMENNWKTEFYDYFELENPDTNKSNKPYNLLIPRSACPHCGHQITAFENIPIISWLLLKGRCRSCKSSISFRYPLVEFITAVSSLFIALHFEPSLLLFGYLFLNWALIALLFIDLDKMLLPDQITIPLIWLGLIINLNSEAISVTDAFYGAIFGYMTLWSLYWIFKLITGKEGMGYGDFKLLAALGAWLGWQQLPLILILSSFVGAIFGIAMIFLDKDKKSKPIPFGPYLAIAGWIALLFGHQINNWYLGFLL